jgi:hypothetical protein
VSDVVTFRFPKKYVGPGESMHNELTLPHVPGKSLKYYYLDTRFTHHLGTKNLRHTVRKVDSRVPVRTSHVPRPGDVFVFIPAARVS